MSEKPDALEWIDADAWGLYVAMHAIAKRSRPLNFDDAAKLAAAGGLEFEHQSDGRTLLKAGVVPATEARILSIIVGRAWAG